MNGRTHFELQISSVATLGQTDKWLREVLFDSMSPQTNVDAETHSHSRPGSGPSSHHRHLPQNSLTAAPKYSIIFPTPDEIRRSLNGYASGSSIHMKLGTAAQQRQLRYLHPYLCQWAGDGEGCSDGSKPEGTTETEARNAGRRRAAPHVKTYIRFSDAERMDSIDWAMVTSANLSTQAWGAGVNANGEVRICSWEIGVVVWPDLFAGGESEGVVAKMVPCFKRDLPLDDAHQGTGCVSDGSEDSQHAPQSVVVGFRMPYDLPLAPYAPGDTPWCATANYAEPDWLGQTWDQ